MAALGLGGGIGTQAPAFAAFLDQLLALGRCGEWSVDWQAPLTGVTGWLEVLDDGKRIAVELDNGPWALAWRSPAGEWRVESHGFPFDHTNSFDRLLDQVRG